MNTLEGSGFAAADYPDDACRGRGCATRRYGAAPPASRALTRRRGDRPAGRPLTPETSTAPGAGSTGRPEPAPVIGPAHRSPSTTKIKRAQITRSKSLRFPGMDTHVPPIIDTEPVQVSVAERSDAPLAPAHRTM